MSKLFSCIIFLSLFFIVFPAEAKLLPRYSNATGNTSSTGSSSVVISPKLRGDRKALIIYFANLSKVKNISYMLTYQGSGVDQGAMGSIDSTVGGSASRELLFGTCSTSVCTYHSSIVNARLEVTIEQLSGKKTIKKYRIKV